MRQPDRPGIQPLLVSGAYGSDDFLCLFEWDNILGNHARCRPCSTCGWVSGFVHLIANCGGIVGPAITGFIVRTTGAFTSAFLLAGVVALLGALVVTVFVRRGSA